MKHTTSRLRLLPVLWVVCAGLQVHAQTGLLNDTGLTLCDNGSNVLDTCSNTNTGDTSATPRQDGRFGRDAAQTVGQLPAKTGAGAAGFDFTKIANNGTALAASATLGTGDTDWACTRDNVTGLVWEVKTTSGLRSNAYTYTWYSTASNNGGNAGILGTNTCGGTLSGYSNQCNTANYVATVNTAGLCGASDWRLPTRRELHSIVHYGSSTVPVVDEGYIIAIQSNNPYWTSDTSTPSPASAWTVRFRNGTSNAFDKSNLYHVSLVRSGQ